MKPTVAFTLCAGLAVATPAWAQMPEIRPTDEPRIVAHLVLDRPPRHQGRAFYVDPIQQRLIDGTWAPPEPGAAEEVEPGVTAHWRPVRPTPEGWIQGRPLVGGYALVVVEMASTATWLCHAEGHSWAYVNGAFRAGDPYANGSVRLPVALAAGRTHLLFHTGRGRLRVRFERVRHPVAIAPMDRTLPTLDVGAPVDVEGAIVLTNSGAAPVAPGVLAVRATVGRAPPTLTPVPGLPARGVRKVAFRVCSERAPAGPGSLWVHLALVRADDPAGAPLHRERIRLPVRQGTDVQRITFRSGIDGSLQYYAVRPSRTDGSGQALFLSLHGAGVEAAGQAAAYSAKAWGHVVAATNRRPFGFDWEDWGRLDALEVLAHASARLAPDPRRVYLTGHSMGGHGTWQVGVLFPDRFAAIGPSAGWIAFSTYGGGRGVEAAADPVVELLARASSPSHTLDYKTNYAPLGVYVLHGEADDNVPADQARRMLQELSGFHRDVRAHFEPEVKHWWDKNRAQPGADCVDWLPMFEFFARRARPERTAVHQVAFRTPSPAVSDRCDWVRVVQQQRCWLPSGVDLRADLGGGRIVGTTENVARLELDLTALAVGPAVTVQLDGQELEHLRPEAAVVPATCVLERDGETWRVAERPLAAMSKRPARYGPFKATFANRFCLVYGTGGSPEAQTWARARARYDAEVFWYRGNASVDVYADVDFDPAAHPDRNVVCYGNAATNRIWASLAGASAVRVGPDGVRVGARVVAGADLAVLACVARPDSSDALVGLIGGTSVRAMRATDTCPIFVSGVAYPDVLVFDADLRRQGLSAVRGAGYFGNDWSVDRGEFAWRGE